MDIDKILIVAKEKIETANNLEELEKINIEFLGKKGKLTECMSCIKNIEVSERPVFGAKINLIKNEITKLLKSKTDLIKTELIETNINKMDDVDLTEIDEISTGSLHPVSIVQREIEEVFKTMGFAVEDGNDVVTEYENFESVNVPANHPARDMQDTFYLDNGQLLKTQTSAKQNAIMRKYGVPCRAIFPGNCYRNESTDAGHDTAFYQMEGVVVDENISLGNMKYFLDTLLSKVLKKKIVSRLRPGYFPFTEPGMELDVQCEICGGKGCSTCKQSGWVEVLPCGMIHPNVLEMAGIDSKKYTGFAFGLGLTRLAMMKYGINDIRVLNSGDLRVLKQFGTK